MSPASVSLWRVQKHLTQQVYGMRCAWEDGREQHMQTGSAGSGVLAISHLCRRERVSVFQSQCTGDGDGLCHVDDAHLFVAAAHAVSAKLSAAKVVMLYHESVACQARHDSQGQISTAILQKGCLCTAQGSAPALRGPGCRRWSRPEGRRCRRHSQAGPLAPGQRSRMKLSSSAGSAEYLSGACQPGSVPEQQAVAHLSWAVPSTCTQGRSAKT